MMRWFDRNVEDLFTEALKEVKPVCALLVEF